MNLLEKNENELINSIKGHKFSSNSVSKSNIKSCFKIFDISSNFKTEINKHIDSLNSYHRDTLIKKYIKLFNDGFTDFSDIVGLYLSSEKKDLNKLFLNYDTDPQSEIYDALDIIISIKLSALLNHINYFRSLIVHKAGEVSNIHYDLFQNIIKYKVTNYPISKEYWVQYMNLLEDFSMSFIKEIENNILFIPNKNEYLESLLVKINFLISTCENNNDFEYSMSNLKLFKLMQNNELSKYENMPFIKGFYESALQFRSSNPGEICNSLEYKNIDTNKNLQNEISKEIELFLSKINKRKTLELHKIKKLILSYLNIKEKSAESNNSLTHRQSILLFEHVMTFKVDIWGSYSQTKKAKIISKLLNKDFDNTRKHLRSIENFNPNKASTQQILDEKIVDDFLKTV